MKLVLDTNILISTLMKSDGVVGGILLRDLHDVEKLSCYFLYVEIFSKKDKILKISKLEEKDLLELLYLVIKQVNFINENQISDDNWRTAQDLTNDIDIKDISFVALSLETDAYLWTGDKILYAGLKAKGFEKVLNTADLIAMIKR
jgi:predicted nucleic acid-binding protein